MDLAGKKGEIKIYTTPWCPFCFRAKKLLSDKKAAFDEIDVSAKPGVRAELKELTGRRTVPNIFIHGRNVGGCDELFALNGSGELDTLLAEGAA